MLLNKYPELDLIEEFLIEHDLQNKSFELHLIYPMEELISKIRRNNSVVSIPGKRALLLEKQVCIEWIGYNTPTFKDPTITP